ncbi:uncharacterized protein LOC144868277 isoform X2 [Branchiostoma floridae x Branchiostoma japonicum]
MRRSKRAANTITTPYGLGPFRGPEGPAGRDGRDGRDGVPGPPGPPGGCCGVCGGSHSYEIASCLVRPLYGPSADDNYSPDACVNYDVLHPEVTALTRSYNKSLAELGLSNVLRDLEDLRDVGLIPFGGRVGPITSGNGTRRRREATHWSRVGNVTSLVYDADSGGEEGLVAFAAPDLENLGEADYLEGPVGSLQADVAGFNNYPATAAEATPSLVQDFDNMLARFDCSSGGSNCDLTRGQDDVVQLDDHWYIVYRPAIEYDPGSMKRAIYFRILIVAWRGFRIFIRCFIG